MTFATLGLIGKYEDASVANTLCALARFLRERGRNVLFDEAAAQLLPDERAACHAREEIGRLADLAIVVGGDGTLLNAARSLAEHGTPLLGINLGRLGFLADVSPEAMETCLGAILDGHYHSEERLLLDTEIRHGDAVRFRCVALNDAVVHKKDVARLIELDTYVNGAYVSTQRSDGLIVASPTGSTAYALSGGGPLLHPTLEALLLVPVCPHTLSLRPLVVDATSEIEIALSERNQSDAQLTCDGQVFHPLAAGEHVVVRRHRKKLRLIHPPGHDYFELLREKLGWGSHPAET